MRIGLRQKKKKQVMNTLMVIPRRRAMRIHNLAKFPLLVENRKILKTLRTIR